MKKREIVPDVKMTRIEDQLQLVAITSHDFFKLLMRKPCHLEIINGASNDPVGFGYQPKRLTSS